MKLKLVGALIALLFPVQVAAQDLSPLGTTTLFDVGPALSPTGKSQGMELLQAALQRPSAEVEALRLFSNGTAVAKLYALCLLRRLKSDEYPARRKELIARSELVTELQGCVPVKRSVREIVRNVDEGSYTTCNPL